MMTKRLIPAAVVLAAATAVLFASPALAVSGTWSTPANLSATGQDANNPQITVDANGLATAIWYLYDGSNIIQSSTVDNPIVHATPSAQPALATTGVDSAHFGLLATGGALAALVGVFFIIGARCRTART